MENVAVSTTDDNMIKKIEKDCEDDVMEKNINLYFFRKEVTTEQYDGYFHFKDYDIEKQADRKSVV